MMNRSVRRLTDTEVHLLRLEIEGMRQFANYLEQPEIEINDDFAFARIVERAIDTYRVDPEKMALEFGVNRTTIGRWKSKKNAPQPMARPMVVSWILQEVRDEAQKLDRLLSQMRQPKMASGMV